MTIAETRPVVVVDRQPFRSVFMPFPIACFTLTLLTDIAYWQTSFLMWHNFSSWLLFAGLVFGGLAVVAAIVDFFTARLMRPVAWPLVIGGLLTLVLAFVNSLLHAGDGWTAIVPYGLILSAVTIIVMAATAWFCRAAIYRVYHYEGVRHVP
jgi:uncharacterized membrane protein